MAKGQVQIQPIQLTGPELVERLRLFFAPKAGAAQIRLLIDLESQPERGTAVWFELPIVFAPWS